MVAAFLEEDGRDFGELGDVGTADGSLGDFLPIWRIVAEGVPVSDIEACWTFDMMTAYNGYLSMRRDYKAAWAAMNERRMRNKDVRRI